MAFAWYDLRRTTRPGVMTGRSSEADSPGQGWNGRAGTIRRTRASRAVRRQASPRAQALLEMLAASDCRGTPSLSRVGFATERGIRHGSAAASEPSLASSSDARWLGHSDSD
ncbi:hypothetical protein [Protofrankia coriariae]|uniref:hypothetical protein n=1 Tax=Protofrankia coriariae TaxID=1562887 RepID=UPI0012F65C96|nr:hypothetical protein [Protofrankia coriariae]